MGSVILDMATSLDGYIGGPNGEDWGLHDWYFNPAPPSQAVIDELVNGLGAIIMGRGTFDMGNDQGGFEGDNPYKMPHFVITHQMPDKLPAGSTPFIFVTDGIESALRQAQAAAGDKPVAIGGGANIISQYLQVGLVDEVQLHVVPALFGQGIPLFGSNERVKLESTRVIESVGVTHLKYRVVR